MGGTGQAGFFPIVSCSYTSTALLDHSHSYQAASEIVSIRISHWCWGMDIYTVILHLPMNIREEGVEPPISSPPSFQCRDFLYELKRSQEQRLREQKNECKQAKSNWLISWMEWSGNIKCRSRNKSSSLKKRKKTEEIKAGIHHLHTYDCDTDIVDVTKAGEKCRASWCKLEKRTT